MIPLGTLSRERWRALEPLLDAALELAPGERTAFLDGECRGDPTLRADVRSLVAACELQLGGRYAGMSGDIRQCLLSDAIYDELGLGGEDGQAGSDPLGHLEPRPLGLADSGPSRAGEAL